MEKDNMKKEIREIECKDTDCNELSQERDKWKLFGE
jgi:hypothetical protein